MNAISVFVLPACPVGQVQNPAIFDQFPSDPARPIEDGLPDQMIITLNHPLVYESQGTAVKGPQRAHASETELEH